MLHSKQCGTANLAHRRITAVLLLLRPPQSRSWLRAARRPMSALAAKPSPEEIERRRRAKRAERAETAAKSLEAAYDAAMEAVEDGKKREAALRAQSDVSYTIVRPTAFFKSVSGQVEVVDGGGPFVYFDLGDGKW